MVKYGDSLNIFLITQMHVNGWPRYCDRRKDSDGNYLRLPNEIALEIRDGQTKWSISGGILKVKGEEFDAPQGWETPITGRRDCYDKAIEIFR